MGKIDKKAHEAQLHQVWRMLIQNKSYEDIATELGVSTKTIQRISLELDERYGELQRQKTDDALYTECNLFKNRMLTLYRGLEQIVTGPGHSGVDKAKCAEVAANISIDILKMESESIRSVKNISTSLSDHAKGNRLLGTIQQQQSLPQQQQQSSKSSIDNMDARGLDDSDETC